MVDLIKGVCLLNNKKIPNILNSGARFLFKHLRRLSLFDTRNNKSFALQRLLSIYFSILFYCKFLDCSARIAALIAPASSCNDQSSDAVCINSNEINGYGRTAHTRSKLGNSSFAFCVFDFSFCFCFSLWATNDSKVVTKERR